MSRIDHVLFEVVKLGFCVQGFIPNLFLQFTAINNE